MNDCDCNTSAIFTAKMLMPLWELPSLWASSRSAEKRPPSSRHGLQMWASVRRILVNNRAKPAIKLNKNYCRLTWHVWGLDADNPLHLVHLCSARVVLEYACCTWAFHFRPKGSYQKSGGFQDRFGISCQLLQAFLANPLVSSPQEGSNLVISGCADGSQPSLAPGIEVASFGEDLSVYDASVTALLKAVQPLDYLT